MNRSSNARRRAEQLLKARSKSNSSDCPDSGIGIRLVFCGIIFVVLVAMKFLFPDTVNGFRERAGQLLGADADFQEAFAAVGRAVSGEGSAGESLQEAYTAVFHPEALEGGKQDNIPDAAPVSGTPPVQPETPETPPAEPETAAVTETGESPEPQDDTATETLAYLYTMPALPENASLEQRNLGFSYASPIQGTLTSTFGWREHPVEGGNKFHYGVDLAAPEGTDIAAFADGTVYASGESSTLGNYIMLQHENGYITLYAHCSKVTAGSGSVAMGEKIAEVGSTGLATGPHLHFELHDGDLYLNPIFYVEVG